MIYIYLHGFNSMFDEHNPKVQELNKIGKVHGITYDSFASYDEIFAEIVSKVPDKEEFVFVGTSLGGFWAAEMGRKFCVPSVIINPCYDPRNMLRKYVGKIQTNYYTNETKVLTQEKVDTYPSEFSNKFSFLPLVLLDMGDEVINSHVTQEIFEGFPMSLWSGGSHRFDHMNEAVEHISEYVNYCSFVENLHE